jgi:ABC-2 type transport system permease protein
MITPWNRIVNVLRKEWKGIFSTSSTASMVTLLPLLILAQVLLVIYLVVRFIPVEALSSSILQSGLLRLRASFPGLALLPLREQFLVYFLLQLPVYLLLVPMMVSNVLCTFSVVEEKQTRTLEPLLATPVRTWELLLAKALAGSLPAVVMSWVIAGLGFTGIILIGAGHLCHFLLTPYWLVSLLLVTPLVTSLSFLFGIIGSSRANDPRSAQGWALPMVLPVLVWVAIQVMGYIPLTVEALLVASAILLAACVLILKAAVALFQRESILIRWR